MDGNVEPTDAAVTHVQTNKIRININVSKIVVANENTVKLPEVQSSSQQQLKQQQQLEPTNGFENNDKLVANDSNCSNISSSSSSSNSNDNVEFTSTDDIEFEYKTSMAGAVFQRRPMTMGGRRETSGLCSIM